MSVTLDTSHFERSPINKVAKENSRCILTMLDTSYSMIGPYGQLNKSPSGDNFRHASTALLSSVLDCGDNAGVGWGRGKKEAEF